MFLIIASSRMLSTSAGQARYEQSLVVYELIDPTIQLPLPPLQEEAPKHMFLQSDEARTIPWEKEL
jgi:hypothetical protein